MWTVRREETDNRRGLRFVMAYDRHPATCAQVLSGWQEDRHFRSRFNAVLAESPYRAFRWETPAITTARLDQPFEFVLLDSPGLARRPDPKAFAGHFTQTESSVVLFPNISGDALMVVPCPVGEPVGEPAGDLAAYSHLAAFVRNAPAWQQDALWQLVGEAMNRRVGAQPVWLSTAGAGVAWLHVRLDTRPKYYSYQPYTTHTD